jgi:hypothetical protein
MPHGTIIITLIVLAIIVAIILPMARATAHEGFSDVASYNTYGQPGTGRSAYIAASEQKYNPLASTMDIRTPNFAKATSPADLAEVNKTINSAIVSALLEPELPTKSNSGVDTAATYLGIKASDAPQLNLPPPNAVLGDATKYEKIRGREAACMKLETPGHETMGVCLKGGTPYSYENPGAHIGGMLVLPEDRQASEDNARRTGGTPAYAPSLGSCEAGSFAVKRSECLELRNRLDCKEAGETGGFRGGGRTAEGVTGIVEAKCAAVPAAGPDTFIYYPKTNGVGSTAFSVGLRVLAPAGTGMCRVMIYNASKQLVAQGTSNTPGRDFVVTIPNTRELTKYQVLVTLQTPHRSRGNPEVFQFIENPSSTNYPPYNQTYESSKQLCERIGTRIATKSEVERSWRNGAQLCSTGWMRNDGQDTGFGGYPMKGFHKSGGCGPNTNNGDNMNEYVQNGKAFSWCYGIKPPQSTNNQFGTWIGAFFNSLRDGSLPSQKDLPNIWSEHGAEYQAPSYRGVLMQWEMADGSQIRTVPFEPTILGINNMGPQSIASDGTKTFKILRRNGTFASSSLIVAPRPSADSKILRNQSWLWSNLNTDATVIFDTQVPGTFTAPFYSADAGIASRGPLITNKETLSLLTSSPCLKEGQESGKYSMECLSNLFVSAGGDLRAGKLATTGAGLAALNSRGSMDDISAYLSGLYTLATTGRDATGARIGGDAKERARRINEASQLLFGFDISTPCEDVVEDSAGNITIVPKTGVLDPECLNYLWNNAGKDTSRGIENFENAGRSTIKATYTSIGDRFSGLRNNEGTKAKRDVTPFAACQRTGTMAPLKSDGSINAVAINTARAAGGITGVQALYDKIHRDANYTPATEGTAAGAADALAKCYGVQKAVDNDTRTGCGVVARYIRVLATGIYRASQHHSASCIQIPQIEVFDLAGTEVAKRRPVQAGSIGYGGQPAFAVDGRAYPRSHGEGEYHDSCAPGSTPDNQFWMVDLGRMTEISEIRFHPRTDCCAQRQLGAPIQLLDESRRIVAQKNLGVVNWPGRWGQTESIKFNAADLKPAIPLRDLVSGTRLSLLSATTFDRYMRAINGALMSAGPDSGNNYSDTYKRDATFTIVSALNGRAGYVSLQSSVNPNNYLRHSGFRMWLHWQGADALYKNDASFRIAPAVNGDPTMVSFESSNYPGHYISTNREAPDQVWITRVNTSDPWDSQRASWKVALPLA